MQEANSLEKALVLGRLRAGEAGDRGGDGEGEGSLVSCNPWRYKELDMT